MSEPLRVVLSLDLTEDPVGGILAQWQHAKRKSMARWGPKEHSCS
jgi:hypothetical protein